MSVENLLNFDRPIPAPFDTLPSKKINNVRSKYGDKTFSTLCAPVMKAILAFAACKSGDGHGAVGLTDNKMVCEYKSSETDVYHLIAYDPNTGKALASVYNAMTEMGEDYTRHKTARDGSAVIMALTPAFLQDDAFQEDFGAFYTAYLAG